MVIAETPLVFQVLEKLEKFLSGEPILCNIMTGCHAYTNSTILIVNHCRNPVSYEKRLLWVTSIVKDIKNDDACQYFYHNWTSICRAMVSIVANNTNYISDKYLNAQTK